jgi:hypothetical protein
MENGKGSCSVCTGLIRLCGGLDYFPSDIEVRKLLVERLHRVAKSHEHAKGMIDRWLDTKTAAPKVADLVDLATAVRIASDSLPAGCDVCRGEPWVVVERGARRCTCTRGQALRAKDAQREEERRGRTA